MRPDSPREPGGAGPDHVGEQRGPARSLCCGIPIPIPIPAGPVSDAAGDQLQPQVKHSGASADLPITNSSSSVDEPARPFVVTSCLSASPDPASAAGAGL